jgi:hypothetical protein
MFWTIVLLACKFCAAVILLYLFAKFIAWKALRDYEVEKQKAQKPIQAVRKIYKKNGEWYVQ